MRGTPHIMDSAECDFDSTVRDALDQLPAEVASVLDEYGIEVIVKETPDSAVSEEFSDALFGLFTGYPLADQESKRTPAQPTRIELYEKAFFRYCDSEAERRDQIIRTVLHEVGHFLGMDEQDLRDRGF